MAADEAYDLVVLDLNLPEMDGFSILKALRRENPQTKVLILSANSELDSKLSGFELGASDYLTKPFHFAELEARIRVLLNRKFVQQSNCLTYEAIVLDTLNRTIEIHGGPVGLTTKEFAILEYFLSTPTPTKNYPATSMIKETACTKTTTPTAASTPTGST